MRILFLDIDGVLIPGPFARGMVSIARMHGIPVHPDTLDPLKVRTLNVLGDVRGLRVVLSSSKRGRDGILSGLIEQGVSLPFHPDWRTGQEMAPCDPDFRWAERGWQIKQWIDRHPGIEGYAIVDDGCDFLPEQEPHFVRTCPEAGLMESHVFDLRRMLERRIG